MRLHIHILFIFFLLINAISSLSQELNQNDSTVTDIDGNVYPIIKIGNQVWMAENLKTTHYSDGIPIEYSVGSTEIAYADTTKRYFYYNDNPVNAETYGCLYTWYAAVRGIKGDSVNPSKIQGIAPVGWHIPSVAEWRELESYLGENAADHLKPEAETGFNAQYGGCGGDLTEFQQLNEAGFYLTADAGEFYDIDPFCYITLILIRTYDHEFIWGGHTKTCGYSVRCVKDNNTTDLDHNARRKLPKDFQMLKNYPNPFNLSTTIHFTLLKSEHISLKIYNLMGQYVTTLIDEVRSAGEQQILWQTGGLPSGIYMARLQSEGQMEIIKLILQK